MSSSLSFNGLIDEFDERSPNLSSPTGRVDFIDSISKKIQDLDTELTSFCPEDELVIESYADARSYSSSGNKGKTFGSGNYVPNHVKKRSAISARDKDVQQMHKFAGIYSLRTVMEKNTNPLDVGSGTENPAKKLFTKIKKKQNRVSKRPMLVELHTFPGFIPNDLTPLPASLSTSYILNIVMDAQKDLVQKPDFRKEFKRMFLSRPSIAVVQDVFWWLFLEKYQSCPEIQSELFTRVSGNYVHLIVNGNERRHRELFLKRYPSLLCQSLYTIFCRAFPTSYRQFDDRFKQDLADVVYLWITGTKPVRRCWQSWPLSFLEPEGMNKEEEIQRNVSKEFTLGCLETGGELKANRSERYQAFSKGSTALNKEDTTRKREVFLKSIPDDTDLFVVSEHTKQPSVRLSCHALNPGRQLLDNREDASKTKLNVSNSLHSTRTSRSYMTGYHRKRESCHAGRGPDFQKVVFDIYGQSPLVKHYLRNKHLARESGTSILVQRTEIDKLPPIDGVTYRDIINESLKSSHELEKQIQSLLDQISNERVMFSRRQKKEREEFRKKEKEILQRQKDVKRISDLILLKVTKTQSNEDEKRIAASIEKALNGFF